LEKKLSFIKDEPSPDMEKIFGIFGNNFPTIPPIKTGLILMKWIRSGFAFKNNRKNINHC
jgi:hypothetical protein